MIRVLIICGAGASSGFIAQRIRKEANLRNLKLKVDARSEAELLDSVADADVVLVGPHLEYMIDEIKGKCAVHGVQAVLIPQAVYGTLDGAKALDLALETLHEGAQA